MSSFPRQVFGGARALNKLITTRKTVSFSHPQHDDERKCFDGRPEMFCVFTHVRVCLLWGCGYVVACVICVCVNNARAFFFLFMVSGRFMFAVIESTHHIRYAPPTHHALDIKIVL